MSTPAAAAASAPVKATWLSASPVKTWRAQHDEVADQPAGERDEGAGEQRVAHELVREHQACYARTRRAAARDGARRGRRAPKASEVT